MPSEPTNKSCYKSPYSDGYITASQYLIERVAEKQAKRDKVDLPRYFWKQDKWAKFFREQVRAANSLLKKYDHVAIARAIKHPDLWWLCSLRAKQLVPYIEQEAKKLDIERARLDEKALELDNGPSPEYTSVQTPQPKPVGILGKLKKLDEE
jgi:hypothetical protein